MHILYFFSRFCAHLEPVEMTHGRLYGSIDVLFARTISDTLQGLDDKNWRIGNARLKCSINDQKLQYL